MDPPYFHHLSLNLVSQSNKFYSLSRTNLIDVPVVTTPG